MNIQSLLNSPSGNSRQNRNTGPRYAQLAQHYPAHGAILRRQKLAKDAPVFSEGTKTVGYVNYPPHEAGNNRDLQACHREFRVFPLGEILRKGVRHIPYASDKKDFLNKTGRDAFEVCQYTYKRPGEDKEYVVVWDYNIGLVRMTPFFKSCKYSKTVPAKSLNQNPGLKDISYSITGGALVCQGYWVPWQAAREIAATFCWDIRWALTPVFGNDFPQMCRPPHDRSLAKFVISPDTVRFCASETARFKEEGTSYQLLSPPKAPSPVTTSVRPVFSSPVWKLGAYSPGQESGYGTDIEHNSRLGFSRHLSPRSQYSPSGFTSVNGAGSPTFSSTFSSPVVQYVPPPLLLPTPSPEDTYSGRFRTKRTHSKVAYSDSNAHIVRFDSPQEEVQTTTQKAEEAATHSPRTLEVAETLMSMGAVTCNKAALPEAKRTRRNSWY
ncbi:DNA-binding domain of Mlu1-box binding protein MBP1 [Didymella exigua CBS 183.55]|uniref:DNA-binding domain of Mlu1-box binding protein MBP1 n=1 Tax=Didymella exigua CBS 183.55 TaxID=1150837 RepID=A0A6A5RNJ3_9PLEO|nr:DNA-binding domain of Mlu1-box binding protein MBP1 [Didymella exigua CBS 183.55]KAF1929981.1 DNA-binding domain of Mlu1-box binding protein MBP1 [Didymella exigua CBS 183.55]